MFHSKKFLPISIKIIIYCNHILNHLKIKANFTILIYKLYYGIKWPKKFDFLNKIKALDYVRNII